MLLASYERNEQMLVHDEIKLENELLRVTEKQELNAKLAFVQ